jgi:hypothetical protein
MDKEVFIFSEIVRCGLIGKIAYESFHKFHNHKLHIFGRKEDFQFITEHPNNIYHILEDTSPIVEAFNHGHSGTAMVCTKVILESKEKYIVHFDSDVVFRGNLVDDIIEKLDKDDIVGGFRTYKNNPCKRDDVRHLPDVTATYCFGFNKEKIYVREPELLEPLIENHLTAPIVSQISRLYPQYRYVPTIDFFDPIAFLIMMQGGTICILDNDLMGGQRAEGDRVNKYGILNKEIDFGDKISHFASVGSGLNFITMMKKETNINVPEFYVNYGVRKLDLYMRLFYNTKILDKGVNDFLVVEEPLREAFGLKAYSD